MTTSHTAERRSFPSTPTQAKAMVLTAHPYQDSFNTALAQSWIEGAHGGGLTTTTMNLADLEFDPVLRVAYRSDQALEPDLEQVRDELAAVAHVTIAFPIWWGSTPANLKGLFDRVLLPGWAFEFADSKFPKPGLKGRSARVITTMDTPTWYDRIVNGAAARRHVGRATLRFSGIKPTRYSTFGSVANSSPKQRNAMLQRALTAGQQDARAVLKRLGAHSNTSVAVAPG